MNGGTRITTCLLALALWFPHQAWAGGGHHDANHDATHHSSPETIVVAGAGPSTRIVDEFFKYLVELKIPETQGYEFVVPQRSIKHRGGVESSELNLFGRTGHPLAPHEIKLPRREILLGQMPICFIVDPELGLDELSLEQLRGLLSGSLDNWQDVGGPDLPVKLVGREPTEASFMALARQLPVLYNTPFALRLKRDHQLVEMMDSPDRRGVLAFGARGNFSEEQILQVYGLAVGLSVGLVYHPDNADHPLVLKAIEIAHSDQWKARVFELGFLPVD